MPPKKTSRERATNKLPVGFATQVIPGTQEQSSNNDALPALGVTTHNTSDDLSIETPPGTPPSWRCKEAPRLLQTDTTEHIQSVVAQIFGAGVDMDLYLAPARILIDHFTKDERDDYTQKGLKLEKRIPASWKRWKAMDNLQKVKFINLMFVLSPEHACILEGSVIAAKETTNKEVNEAIGLNRTMHEYARTMHVMSSSDNLAAISKAFGRYTRLELDENQSKLHEDLQTSVDGWKQLAIVYNDQNVTYLRSLSFSFTIFIVFGFHFRA
jgi:hypothetical protein